MTEKELQDIVGRLRNIGGDTQRYEVKACAGGLSKSIVETLSAFANGQGGALILGLSEEDGFRPAPGFRAADIGVALADAGTKLTPAVRPEVEIIPFEGAEIVVANIWPMPMEDRPCHVTGRGAWQGSYIRVGDGDRRLSKYEVDRLMEGRRQPQWDAGIVPDAVPGDLDADLLNRFMERQRFLHPQTFQRLPDEEILCNLRVLSRDDAGVLRPTMAGLLAIGTYPQKYFPSLVVAFAHYPEAADNLSDAAETRFLNSRTLDGPIPLLVAEATELVRSCMRIGAVIEGAFRRDVPEYPLIAVREAVANALQHRDYSPEGRASAVNINLHADRLEILNPGGLYGRVTPETLGHPGIASSRNQFLSRLLETTPTPHGGFVVENRGSGIRAIRMALKEAGLPDEEIWSAPASFRMTFFAKGSAPHAMRTGGGRGASGGTAGIPAAELDDLILKEAARRSSVGMRDLIAASGWSRSTLAARVRDLIRRGELEGVGPSKSPQRRYRRP